MKNKIGIDIMGGDLAPLELAKGLYLYLQKYPNDANDFFVYFTKDFENKFNKMFSGYNVNKVICENFILPTDSATILRSKPNATLVCALQHLQQKKISTLISTCNTKAYILTAAVFLKKIQKNAKIVLATPLPRKDGGQFFFLDVGARVNYEVFDFLTLAIYGIECAKLLFNKNNPTIRLINVGSESGKGDSLHIEADKLLLKEYPNNYKGNMDPYNFMSHKDDVVLTDGFSGNILSKSFEGGIELITSIIKNLALKSWKNKLVLLALKKSIKKEMYKYDYRSKGAAYILGFENILFKAHGRSDSVAIHNAIKTARQVLESDFIYNINKNLNRGKKDDA